MSVNIQALITRLRRGTFIPYTVVSVLALVVDSCTLLLLHHMGLMSWLASALAYMVGAALHWILSIRFVFDPPRDRRDYLSKLTQYLIAGAGGVVITAGTIHLMNVVMGLNLIISKGIAVILVFNLVYLARLLLMKRQK